MRASAKNRKHRKEKNDKGKWDTWQPLTMHVFGVDTGVGDWGNQDKETGEHKKDCFRI